MLMVWVTLAEILEYWLNLYFNLSRYTLIRFFVAATNIFIWYPKVVIKLRQMLISCYLSSFCEVQYIDTIADISSMSIFLLSYH